MMIETWLRIISRLRILVVMISFSRRVWSWSILEGDCQMEWVYGFWVSDFAPWLTMQWLGRSY